MVSHFAEDLLMPTYNGIEVTEDFYTFFAPHFLHLISPIRDPEGLCRHFGKEMIGRRRPDRN